MALEPDREERETIVPKASLPLDKGALEGVRIVELAQFVFVPASAAILADHGAEVIKIEPPTGDPYRTLKIADGRQTADVNFAMEQNNRSKKSVGIDLKTHEGHDVFLRLIETADVFITSIRPDTLDRLGLGLEALRKVNPKLIYVRGNGLGYKGEEANRPGFDASCFWARGGFAGALSIGHDTMVRQRPGQGDHTAAVAMAMGIVTALFKRERTGEPSLVEVSLLGTAMWVLSSDVTQAQAPTYSPGAMAAVEFKMPLTRAYKTADERWMQLMFLDPERYWQGLCNHLGHPELADDPRFATVADRAENGRELAGILDTVFGSQPFSHWEAAFAGFDAPWERIQTVQEVLADPQAEANGYVFDVMVRDDLPVRVVAGPVSIDGSPLHAEPRRAPHLGEHTDEVLGALGLNGDCLTALRAAGGIA
jgi:crotonobetainyl-CoA:carnitine CoA-transferase CaiB-like acyl-CoA transferase